MGTRNFHEVRKRILATNNASQAHIDSLPMITHTILAEEGRDTVNPSDQQEGSDKIL